MSISEKRLALIQLFQATVEQLKYTNTLSKPVYLTREDAEEILEALWRPESKIPAGPKQEPTTQKNYLDSTKKKETPYSYHLPLTREEFLAAEAAIENELAHSLPYRKLLQEYRSILVQVATKILLKKSELL